jgi:hypothetical protein
MRAFILLPTTPFLRVVFLDRRQRLRAVLIHCRFHTLATFQNMYIDDAHASISSMKSSSEEHDVKEATAALKGLLGLGTASSQSTPSPSARPAESLTEALPSIDAPKQQKKKKNKKKKPASAVSATDDMSTPPSNSSNAAAVVSNSSAKVKSKHHPSKKNKKKESENYSLSAFQSSPDASKLPTPSFLSSPPAAVGKSSVTTSASTPSPNGSHVVSIPEAGELDVQLPVANETKIVDTAGADSLHLNETTKEEPVSTTGVNLAAAIAAEQPSVSPPMYAPQHYNAPMYPPPPQHHPMYHNPMPPQPMPPQHAMYGTPPGYVTIPVQVPPHLIMPGRHMVVTSPAGYPVQVAVPEGIAPGMVIPVHVPVGPPLHMMPYPPPPYPNQTQGPPSSNNQYPH